MEIYSNLPDLQKKEGFLHPLCIQQVGIKGLRYPMEICDQGTTQSSIVTLDLAVSLTNQERATHMSRLAEIINEKPWQLSVGTIHEFTQEVCQRLNSQDAYMSASFTFLRQKLAPISRQIGYMDYQVTLFAKQNNTQQETVLQIQIPVTTLCPCSKAISKYGAHNQRCLVTISLNLAETLGIQEMIELVESQASCDLYSVLKRPDEKFVTERAFEQPKFVEDLVRDIALLLSQDQRVRYYRVITDNLESIHNHSAYARIDSNQNECGWLGD